MLPVKLDYASRPVSRKRRRVLAVLLLILVVSASLWWGPPYWHQAMYLVRVRRCLNYTAPPDLVVFETDPDEAVKLLPLSPWYISVRPPPNSKRSRVKTRAHTPFESDTPFQNTVYFPPELRPFPEFGALYVSGATAIAFAHRRTSPCGHERLVVVGICDDMTSRGEVDSCLGPGVAYSLPGWQPGTRITKLATFLNTAPSLDEPNLRVFAGQPDPADASHFTIEFEMRAPWTKIEPFRGIIDGWLHDDDSISLTKRDKTTPIASK